MTVTWSTEKCSLVKLKPYYATDAAPVIVPAVRNETTAPISEKRRKEKLAVLSIELQQFSRICQDAAF